MENQAGQNIVLSVTQIRRTERFAMRFVISLNRKLLDHEANHE